MTGGPPARLIPEAHRLILVRHARSEVDPARPPQEWGLAEAGRRAAGHLAALGLFDHAAGYYAGAEPKLEQTLAPVAAAHGKPVQTEAGLGETGSRGWLGEEEFRATVGRFFADPTAAPAPGWESGATATARFGAVVDALQARHGVVVLRGHALPGTFAVASGGRMLTAYLAVVLGLDAGEAFATWQGLRMPDLAVLDLEQPGRPARLVIPFGTLTV
jgi:broad specificity phosphatase PhoE